MLRVRTVWQSPGGGPYLSTMYFAGTTQTEADDAVSAVGTWWGAVDAFIDSNVSWATEAEVAQIDAATGQATAAYATTPATGTGGVSGNILPFVSQGLVRWRTGDYIGGREVRGRTFIPGLASTQNTEGKVTAATVTAVNALAVTLIADSSSALWVWSREHGAGHAVTSGQMWTEFAGLRSRRPTL